MPQLNCPDCWRMRTLFIDHILRRVVLRCPDCGTTEECSPRS